MKTKELKSCIISSRVTPSVKHKLEKIKRQYGYSTGILLEMSAENLVMSNKQDILHTLSSIEHEVQILKNQKEDITQIISNLSANIEDKTKMKEYYEEQLNDKSYDVDQSLLNAARSFINAKKRRDEKFNKYGLIADTTESELLQNIANKNCVNVSILEQVVRKITSNNQTIVQSVHEVINEENNDIYYH